MQKAKSPSDIACLETALSQHGLAILGATQLSEELCAPDEISFIGHHALLVGNAGASMWPHFSKSAEFDDGHADPMNRWTWRIINNLTEDLDCEFRFPFNYPYWPFQRIALATVQMNSSPLGILIHPEYGLWHAFRAVIIASPNSGLAMEIERMIHQVQKMIHPCETCVEKPCLSACPVNAFDGTSLDRETCFSHIDLDKEPKCLSSGCAARNACPIGLGNKYGDEQIKFHMKSYRGAE